MLECRQLRVSYGAVEALREVNITARPGAITAILGPNGAGKSSLMKTIAGLVPVAGGRVRMQDEDITGWSPHTRARAGLSLALEGRRLMHRMTVEENLRVSWEFRGRGNDFAGALERAYTRFPVLATRRGTQAGLLSGGQQQMLILSAALIHEPRVLLLDEPSLGLAPLIVDQIFAVIVAECQQKGTTILLSEQVVGMALDIAQYAYVMNRGRVLREGSGAELARDHTLMEAYLGH